MNSIVGPGMLCLDRHPLKRMQKNKRRAFFRARLSAAARVALFRFRRSRQREQIRLRQGSKRVNFILGGAVSSVRSQTWNPPISWDLLHRTTVTRHLPVSSSRREASSPPRMDVPAYHDGGTRQDAFSGSEKPFHLVMRRLSSIAQSTTMGAIKFSDRTRAYLVGNN